MPKAVLIETDRDAVREIDLDISPEKMKSSNTYAVYPHL